MKRYTMEEAMGLATGMAAGIHKTLPDTMKRLGYGGILRRFSTEAQALRVEILLAEIWAISRAALDVLGVHDGGEVAKVLLEGVAEAGPQAGQLFVKRAEEYDQILLSAGAADEHRIGENLAIHAGIDPKQDILHVLNMGITITVSHVEATKVFAQLQTGQIPGQQAFKG